MSDESPVNSRSEGPGQPEPSERALRTNLLMSGTIEAEDIAAPVRIRNLSETGALLEGAALPKVGARLVLRRLHLEIGGTVVWSESNRCGVKFAGTISVAGWRSGNWIAPVGEVDQARVDSIQAAVRGGQLPAAPAKTRPDWIAEQIDVDIDARVADELTALRRLLEDMGAQFSDERMLVERYPGTLQRFDFACQILGHLADLLKAGNRNTAIDAIGMEELRQRLRRKPGRES